MTTPDSAPPSPRLPDTPAKPARAPPSQIDEARNRARLTHDSRALAEYLILRRGK